MEQVICNLCNADTETELIESFGNGISLVKCKTCGLIYQNPRPTEAELLQYYNGTHHILNASSSKKLDLLSNQLISKISSHQNNAYLNSRRDFFRPLFSVLADLLPRKAKLCDLGCGEGMLLDFLRSGELAATSEYEIYGIEPSTEPAKRAIEKGYSIFEGIMENCNRKKYFDVILMNDVFEHLPDPLRTLNSAREMLVSGGYIFIRVPNIPGIILKSYLMRKFQSLKKLQGSSSKGIWAIPDHTYNFSFDLLSKFAIKSNFSVVKRGVVPFEIYSNNFRKYVAKFLNVLFGMVWHLTGRSFHTAIYVVLRK